MKNKIKKVYESGHNTFYAPEGKFQIYAPRVGGQLSIDGVDITNDDALDMIRRDKIWAMNFPAMETLLKHEAEKAVN